MSTETKRNWQTLFVWIVLMVGTYFIHGFPNLWWFLGGAWVSLIVAGVLVLIWEKVGFFSKKRKAPGNTTQDKIKVFAHTSEQSGNKSITATSMYGKKVDIDSFDLPSVLQRATTVKGKPLSQNEIEQLESLVAEYTKLKQEFEALRAQHEKDVLNIEKVQAERIVAREARKVRIKQKTGTEREKLLEERDQIKAHLRALGYRVNDAVGAKEEDKNRLDGYEAFQRAKAHYMLREDQQALEHLDKAIECGHYDEAYEMRAFCLQKFDFHVEAIEDFSRAISQRPYDCNLYFVRSFSKSATGDIDGSIEDLQKAIELSKVDNELNRAYSADSKNMGWPDGHTSVYVSHLMMKQLMKQMPQELRDRSKEKNLKRRKK